METPTDGITDTAAAHEHAHTPAQRRPLWLFAWVLLTALFSISAGATAHYLSRMYDGTLTGQTASAASAAENPFANLELKAKAVYIYDISTGKTLYALNPDVQLPLASITKVPLALVVAEVVPPDTIITIPLDTSPPGSIERLGAGEKWALRDVMTFTLVASSNAGAEILAEVANDAVRARYPDAPATEATLWRMNALARELGLNRTYFLNVSGLDMSDSQAGAYGTARDVASLFMYAASTSHALFGGTVRDGLLLTSADHSVASPAINTNEALGSLHGLVMGKTGYTDLAGGNLAVLFEVGLSHQVVAVVLGSSKEGRFEDMRILVAAAEEAIALQ